MKLGKNIATFFVVALILGSISLVGSAVTLMVDESPYRFGRLAGLWFLIQLCGSVVLLYSGMFGLITCNVTEVTARRFNMKIIWGTFIFVALLFMSSIWIAASDLLRHHSATTGDWVAICVSMITIVVSAFYYVQACRYFMRLHRLRRPYEDLLG